MNDRPITLRSFNEATKEQYFIGLTYFWSFARGKVGGVEGLSRKILIVDAESLRKTHDRKI